MWVLILTLSFTYNGNPVVSMIHLDGFKTKEGCEDAGRQWEAEQRKKLNFKEYTLLVPSSMCHANN